MNLIFLSIFMLCLSVFGAAPGYAYPVYIETAAEEIEVDSRFTGAHFSVFGQRELPGDLVVTLEGPKRKAVVRKKEKVLGAWVNRHWVKLKDSPAFYDFAVNDLKFMEELSPAFKKENLVGVKALMPSVQELSRTDDKLNEFQQAYVRNKQDEQLYPEVASRIKFIGEDFFRVDFGVNPHGF